MHDKLAKIMSKKRDLSDNERDAKMEVVKHLRDMASQEMGSKLDGLKKVSVASNSSKGLEKGLSKAKEIVSSGEEHEMLDEAEAPYSDEEDALEEHEGEEGPDELGLSEGGQVDKAKEVQDSMRKAFNFNEGGEVPESEEHELSEEELDRKIEELMALKSSLKSSKS